MFQAYSSTPTIYAQNTLVNFPKIKVSDDRIEYGGNTEISIKSPGKYLIQFNGVGAANTAASPFSLQLYKDDIPIPDAVSTITSTVAGEQHTLSFNTIVTVPRSCCVVDGTTRLSVIATGAITGALSMANIIITKLR